MKCSIGNAIIIAITSFQDYDAILTLFTEKHGKITVIAKGIRKSTSKNKGHCRIGALVEYEVFLGKNHGMGRLKKITTIISCLSEDIKEQTRLMILCEISNTFLSDNKKEEDIFDLWKEILSVFPLNEKRMRGFLCRFFQIEGLFPVFKKKIAEPFFWDSEYGITSESSLSSAQKKISFPLLKFFYFASLSPLLFTEKIDLSKKQQHEWWEIFWWYYSFHSDYMPRSKTIYEKIAF